MKKNLLSIAAVLLLLVSFTSCEKDENLTEQEKLELQLKDTGHEEVGDPDEEEDEEDGL